MRLSYDRRVPEELPERRWRRPRPATSHEDQNYGRVLVTEFEVQAPADPAA
jgi:hypothetical protein